MPGFTSIYFTERWPAYFEISKHVSSLAIKNSIPVRSFNIIFMAVLRNAVRSMNQISRGIFCKNDILWPWHEGFLRTNFPYATVNFSRSSSHISTTACNQNKVARRTPTRNSNARGAFALHFNVGCSRVRGG